MIINLNSETHPQAEIVAILLDKSTVDFRWVGGDYNGVCNAPYTAVGEIPTEVEIKTGIEAIL